MRTILTIVLMIHGAIHLMGFLKWSKLAPVPQLNDRVLVDLSPTGARIFATFWLIAMLLLLAAAAFRLGKADAWWIPALAGMLVSQCLIVVAWHDAKFGTIANVILLLPALSGFANTRFVASVNDEARALLAQASSTHNATIEKADLEKLPAPVRKWLETSGVVGRAPAQTIRLKQRGELRTSPEGAWMPALAEQYFSTEPPAFVWKVDTTMMGFVPIAGRDKYIAGHGNMLIKAGALVSIVDAADEKIDMGSMLRYLGEMVWFPSAATSPGITWEAIDATNAKATMQYQGSTVSAIFTFHEQGRVAAMKAERFLGGGAEAKLTPWVVSCTDWRMFQGVEVPSRGDVGWVLPTGNFSYYRWEILDVEYDSRMLYE